jgi:acetyl/propionyl-CoA carboxylase alpha subunit
METEAKGHLLLIVEAMKMEHRVTVPPTGLDGGGRVAVGHMGGA